MQCKMKIATAEAAITANDVLQQQKHHRPKKAQPQMRNMIVKLFRQDKMRSIAHSRAHTLKNRENKKSLTVLSYKGKMIALGRTRSSKNIVD